MKYYIFISFLFLSFCLFSFNSFAQDTTKSLAFKENKARKKPLIFYQPDLSYELWQQLHLRQEANAGNVLAEHELGLRYLLGNGVKADTVLGAYWIKRAADKRLTAASFNFGILCLNGWGVEWDPFLAFDYFKIAADDGMPEAQYVIGSFYTDNLVVKRNWNKAYIYFKKSSDAGYASAQKALDKVISKADTTATDTVIQRSNKTAKKDTSVNKKSSSSLELVFIDFESQRDTTEKTDNEALLRDLTLIDNNELTKSVFISEQGGKDSIPSFDSLDISLVLKAAENGSPEALTLLGRCYEEGRFFRKDIITALSYYLRAIRMDSPRAPELLYNIMKEKSYVNILKQKADQNDAEAMFVWNGLYSLGFDNSIAEQDAFNLLARSASSGFLPAMVEYATAFYSGKTVKQDQSKGIELLKQAENLGSKDAMVRLLTTIIFDGENPAEYSSAFGKLTEASDNGSMLAQLTLAHCYETGKGTKQNISEAVEYYRHAASRGSQFAYKELVRLYDDKRPVSNPQFHVEN